MGHPLTVSCRCRPLLLKRQGAREMALDGCLTLARVAQARGDGAGAMAALRQAEAAGREGSVAQYAERIDVARAWLWLTATPPDLAVAARWAEGREHAWRAGGPLGHVGVLERLTLARLRLAQGRLDEAATLLPRLLGDAEAGGLVGCLIEILALQARLHAERDQPTQAMMALTRALMLAEPEGYIRPFVDEGAPMVALLRQAQRRGVTPGYVATLLAAYGGGHPAAAPVAAAALVEPISAREQELLQLLAAGLSTAEIASQLFITQGTVRNHLKSIFGKLDAHSRLQAVERARVLGLL